LSDSDPPRLRAAVPDPRDSFDSLRSPPPHALTCLRTSHLPLAALARIESVAPGDCSHASGVAHANPRRTEAAACHSPWR